MLHLKPFSFAKLHIWKKYKHILKSFEVSLTPVFTDALCFDLQMSLVFFLFYFFHCLPIFFLSCLWSYIHHKLYLLLFRFRELSEILWPLQKRVVWNTENEVSFNVSYYWLLLNPTLLLTLSVISKIKQPPPPPPAKKKKKNQVLIPR